MGLLAEVEIALEAEPDSVNPFVEQVLCVKLNSSQVANSWEKFLRVGIQASFGRQRLSDLQLSSIYQELLSGRMETWCLLRRLQDGTQKLLLVATLRSVYDDLLCEKNLVVYSVHALSATTMDEWKEAARFFYNYLVTGHYKRLQAYTSDARILQVCKAIGANTETRLVSLEV